MQVKELTHKEAVMMLRPKQNRLSHFLSLCTYWVSLLLFHQGTAEAQMLCSFNGNRESCTVIRQKDTERPYTATRSIRWHSDGKVVTYKFTNCRNTKHPWAWKCNALITEDSGLRTHGEAILTSGGITSINSERGNKTTIPMSNMK